MKSSTTSGLRSVVDVNLFDGGGLRLAPSENPQNVREIEQFNQMKNNIIHEDVKLSKDK